MQARELSGFATAEACGQWFERDLLLSPAQVATIVCAEQIFATPNLLASDMAHINPPLMTTAVTTCAARVSSAGNVAISWVNPTAGNVTPAASGIYRMLIWRR